MNRRTFVAGFGSFSLCGTAGCTRIPGGFFDNTPRKFEIQNDSNISATIEVRIDASGEQVLQGSYMVPAGETVTKSWPGSDVETYKITVTGMSDESIYGFDPADWGKRHTPLILITEDGVEVFIPD